MNPNISKVGVKFSKENQPSPEAKSEGKQAWEDRRRLKDDLMSEFVKPLVDKETGEQKATFEAGILMCKSAMFDKKSKLGTKEKTDLFLKFCDFVGIDEQDLNIKGGLNVTIQKEDADL